jgi:RNA polymerase sigma-70 factor (sigma-E family)
MRVFTSLSRDDQFRLYVTRQRGSLLRMATLLSYGNPHRAEDLVQTVLLRLYLSWTKVRSDTRDAYVHKMLVNAHLDERRRRHVRHEVPHAEVPDVESVEDAEPLDIEATVFRALAQLPPRMRAAVILRYVYDVSVADTADALGCSEGTVKSQTARGLAQMRAALNGIAIVEKGHGHE